MFWIVIFLVTLFTAYFISWVIRIKSERKGQPPGPVGFPLVGVMPYMSSTEPFYEFAMRLSKQYGEVFQVTIGMRDPTVFICSGSIMRELFKRADCVDRPQSRLGDLTMASGEGNVFMSSGDKWKFCRKVVNRSLGIFTAEKLDIMESNFYVSGEWLCDQFICPAESVDTKPLLVRATGAMVSSIIFGNKPDPGTDFNAKLVDIVQSFTDNFADVGMVDIFPKLEPFYKKPINSVFTALCDFVEHVRSELKRHPYDGTVNTISDSIQKAAEEVPPGESNAAGVTDADIRDCAIDLFDAGYFTTSENLGWMFLTLASYPEIQNKVQEEIDTKMSTPGYPKIKADWGKLHYSRAVVTEVLRYFTNVAVGIAHTNHVDITLSNGMIIPANSQITALQYAINHDPKEFPDPDVFKPERFIREDGSFNQELSEKLVSFGNGKRRCPGEQLARHQLFLFLVFVAGRLNMAVDMTSFEKNPFTTGRKPFFTNLPGDHKLKFSRRM